MSRMNDLVIAIREFCPTLSEEQDMTAEISDYLDGELTWEYLSAKAKAIVEEWETGNVEEIYGTSALQRDLNTNDDDQFVSFSEENDYNRRVEDGKGGY
jgi:hypothetical protein